MIKEITNEIKYAIKHPVETIIVFSVLMIPTLLAGIIDKFV